MDFPKLCSTSVQLLDGFSEIHCRVYSQRSLDDESVSPQSSSSLLSGLRLLQSTQVLMHKVGVLVALDASGLELWVFGNSEPQLVESFRSIEPGTQSRVPLCLEDGQVLDLIRVGDFASAELLDHASISSEESENYTSSDAVRMIGGAHDPQRLNTRAVGLNARARKSVESNDFQKPDIFEAYRHFMQACVESLSFNLAKNHGMIPLNFRTFASIPSFSKEGTGDAADTSSVDSTVTLIDVNIELTPDGALLWSSRSSSESSIRQVNPPYLDHGYGTQAVRPKLIRIAPSGRIAVLVPREVVPGTMRLMQSNWQNTDKPQLPATKINDLDGRLWRSRVLEWLEHKGIALQRSGEDGSWISIVFTETSCDDIENQVHHEIVNENICLEWPVELCFEYLPQKSFRDQTSSWRPNQGPDEDESLKWFQSSNSYGFEDPLESFLTFWKDQSSREAQVQTREAQTTADEEDAQSLRTSTLVDMQSPTYVRGVTHLDSTNGIYPTPPDGLPSGVTPGSSSLDGTVGPIAAQLYSRATYITEPDHYDHITSQELDDENPHGDVNTLTDLDPGEANFGDADADDDLFDSHGMTEADFNFFDEPEMDIDELLTSQPEVFERTEKSSSSDQVPKKLEASDRKSILLTTESSKNQTDTLMTDVAVKQGSGTQGHPQNAKIHKTVDHTFKSEPPVTPPLNPMLVEQDLLPQSRSPPSISNHLEQLKMADHEHSWGRLSFGSGVWKSDLKYSGEGRYGVLTMKTISDIEATGASGNATRQGLPTGTSPSDPRSYTNPQRSNGRRIPRPNGLSHTSSHLTLYEDTSDVDTDYSTTEDEMFHSEAILVPQSKRRRLMESSRPAVSSLNSGTSALITTSCASVFQEADSQDRDLLGGRLESLLEVFFSSHWSDWTLVEFPAPGERSWDTFLPFKPTSQGLVEIAQLVTAQVATSTSDLEAAGKRPRRWDYFPGAGHHNSSVVEAVRQTFGTVDQPTEQNLFTTTTIRGRSFQTPQTRFRHQPKANTRRMRLVEVDGPESSFGSDHAIFPITAPCIRLQKVDTTWEFLPIASSFWEMLGLGPVSGPKVVKAYCIYPSSAAIEPSIRIFFDALEGAWESCRLGSHQLAFGKEGAEASLIPIRIDGQVTRQSAVTAIKNSCESLGSRMRQSSEEDHWEVVYIVNPFEGRTALQELCSCFWALLRSYDEPDSRLRGRRKIRPILQILPIKLIASSHELVFVDSHAAACLAREVYDRCMPGPTRPPGADLPIVCAASVNLAESIPQRIQFRLTSDPPSDLLHDNSCMHVAYSRALDDMWITAAWTDNTGRYQHTACYSMAGGQTFKNVAQEIWEATLEYIKPRKVTWRLFLTKTGPMTSSENTTWQNIVTKTPGPKQSLTIALISVNTSPIFNVYYKSPQLYQLSVSNQAATYSTPINTPQTHAFSPGPTPPSTTATVSTPSAFGPNDMATAADTEPSARLVDITDESWGLILARHLNVSHSVVDYNPALASGYLMKRTGVVELENPVVMEVNVMACVTLAGASHNETLEEQESEFAKQKRYDALLKDVLIMYRGLGLLARLRNMEGVTSCTPWHVAAAMKAAHALRTCMTAQVEERLRS